MARPTHRCLARTRAGLGPVAATELAALGVVIDETTDNLVRFRASERNLYAAARWCRTTVAILVEVEQVRASTFGALERGLAIIDWAELLGEGPRTLRVSATQATLHHTGAVAERVETAIAAAIGPAPSSEDPGVLVDVHVEGETATVRLDATGNADRRGWRLETSKAPLPPTVAAAMLRTIGWDGTTPLLDPMCGSGTIPIEAADVAAGRGPHGRRELPLTRWASFAPGTWASAGAQQPRPERRDADPRDTKPAGTNPQGTEPAGTGSGDTPPTSPTPTILASDRDRGATEATSANAERAGAAIAVATAPISESGSVLADLPPGWVVTNPPWGGRIDGGGDLRDLYASLGALITAHEGWRLAFMTADGRLAAATGLDVSPRWTTRQSGHDVTLWTSSG